MGVTSVLLWKDSNGGHQGLMNFQERVTTLLGTIREKRRWDDVIVEAEHEMENIIDKLKNLWKLRQTVIYEGYTYIIGDFLIHVAAPQNNYKGILVEVEYTSTVNHHVAAPILHEFIGMLKSPGIEIVEWKPDAENSFSKIGLSEDTFTRAHTDYQYMMIFKLGDLL